MRNHQVFTPLAMSEFFRMGTYSKETQAKMKDAWSSQETNP